MAKPKPFKIKETLLELRKLHRSSGRLQSQRLRAMIVFKQHEEEGVSITDVARRIGAGRCSVKNWRSTYIANGIAPLLVHERVCHRPSSIKPEQEVELREKLNDPANGIRGYTELMAWFNERFDADIKYKTLNGYVKRKYGALCKTARKSHVNKDPDALEAFKKTSSPNVLV